MNLIQVMLAKGARDLPPPLHSGRFDRPPGISGQAQPYGYGTDER